MTMALNSNYFPLGDQDVRDATIDKAHYLAQIGDKEESIKIFGTGKHITVHDDSI